MKKKTLYTVTALLFVLMVFFLFLIEHNRPETLSNDYSSYIKDDLNSITDSRRYSNQLNAELYFDGAPLILDKETDRLFYCIKDPDQDIYDPVITHSDNYEIAFDRELNRQMMRDNKTARLIIYDDDRYREYELVITNLPLIDIRMFDEQFFGNYQDASILIVDNKDAEYGYGEYDGKVRIRGGSSSEFPKPGLRIELDKLLKGDNNTEEKDYQLFGLERDNEYVLYTSNVEKDMIRNVFATNLWYDTCADDNAFGLKAGMSYQYVEVFINDKYWGLCAIGNPIGKKRDYVDLHKDSEKYLIENIYKANFFGERDYLNIKKYDNYGNFDLKTNVNVKEAWDPLCDYLEKLLYSDHIDVLYDCMDIDNAIDIYLFYNLTQAWDNVWYEEGVKFRNTYLVSKVDDEGNVRFLYLPWDLDRTWGHETETGEYLLDETKDYEMVMIPIENLLQMNDPEIKGLIYDKYKELRSDKWSDENIVKMLEKYDDEVHGSGAFERDKVRWDVNEHSDDKDLNDFSDYVLRRFRYFDSHIEEMFGQS